MTITLDTFRATVDHIISADDNELDIIPRQDLIKAAVERYSHDLPDIATIELTGDGGRFYAITSLTDWSEGFSQIVSFEYPAAVVASDEAVSYLDPEDWDDNYWAKSGSTYIRYLYLPNHAPAAADTMRIRYTVPYSLSSGAYDIPPAHFYAVCTLAAGLCAQAIAQKYSRTNDSLINADSVNHISRAGEWARRARELIETYEEQLNISAGDGKSSQPAGEFVDWDTKPGDNRQWLFHGDR